MDSLILYGSRYGSAKRYAESLSSQSGIHAVSHKEIPDLSAVQTVVYIGSLYAGGVLGLRKLLRRLPEGENFRLLLATVGISDPAVAENAANIRASLQKQIPPALFCRTKIFHLRGALNYPLLSATHRTALTLLKKSLERTPQERWSTEDHEFWDTYGKQIDFVDLSALTPLLEELKK